MAVALGAGAIGFGAWWWMGSANAAPAVTAGAAGTKDGCAAGTADGAKGVEVINPGNPDDPVIADAAKTSGDAVAYLSAYSRAYSDCYLKAHPVTKDTVPPKPSTPPPKPSTSTGPVVTTPGLDTMQRRMNSFIAYQNGCRAGIAAGYNVTHNHAPETSGGSGAASSDNPLSYRAGWADGYAKGKFAGPLYAPSVTAMPDDLKADYFVKCSKGFDAWYATNKTASDAAYKKAVGTAGVAGVRVGVGSILTVGGVAVVGRRAPQVVNRGPGSVPADALRDSTIYRSV